MHLDAAGPSSAISLISSPSTALLPPPFLNMVSSFPSYTYCSFFMRCFSLRTLPVWLLSIPFLTSDSIPVPSSLIGLFWFLCSTNNDLKLFVNLFIVYILHWNRNSMRALLFSLLYPQGIEPGPAFCKHLLN